MWIRKVIRGAWHFCWGNLFALFLYDRRYLQGRYFQGKLHGMGAIGWEWVTHDAIARIFLHCNAGVPCISTNPGSESPEYSFPSG